MTDLTEKLISNTYKQVILVSSSTSNTGVSTSLKPVQTGDGTKSALQVATNAIQITGALGVGGNVSLDGNLHVDDKVCASSFYGDGSNITGVTATIAGDISVSNAVVGGNLKVSGTTTLIGATHLQAAISVGGAAHFGSTVTVSGTAQLQGAVTVAGAATFKSTVSVSGNVGINGNTSIGGVLGVTGAGTFTAKTEFKNDVSVSGRLDVATSVCVGGLLNVVGIAKFNDDVSVSGNIHTDGNVTAAYYYGDGSNLTNVEAELGVTTNISVSGYINVGGSVSVSGPFNVVGAATFQDNVSVSGNVNINGTTTIAGAVSLASTLSVGGASNFASTVTVVGAAALKSNVTIGGTLAVAGNTSVGGTFLTTGKAEFEDDVSVSGALIVAGAAQFNSTVTIAGAIHLQNGISVSGTSTFNNGSTAVIGTFITDSSDAAVVRITNAEGTDHQWDLGVGGSGHAVGENSFYIRDNTGTENRFIIDSNGKTTFKDSVSVSGNVNIGGTVTVAGAVSLASTLSVGGAANFASTVTIAGTNVQAVNAKVCASAYYGDGSNLTGISGGQVTGNISVNNATIGGTLYVGSTVTVAGTAIFEGAVSVSGTMDIAGNTSIGGTLFTTGKATFDDDVSVSGALIVGGTTTIVGATHLQSTASIGGAATFASTVTVVGATHLQSTVSVNGVMTLNDNLDMQDSDKIVLGTGNDLEIFHDGDHSNIIHQGSGTMHLKSVSNLFLDVAALYVRSYDAGETMIAAADDAAVTLYYDGGASLATNATGVAVTGNVAATGTVEPAGDTAAGDNAAIGYTAAEGLILAGQGSTSDLTVKNDADETVISIPTGTRTVQIAGNIAQANTVASGNSTITINNGDTSGDANEGSAVVFSEGGTMRSQITSNFHSNELYVHHMGENAITIKDGGIVVGAAAVTGADASMRAELLSNSIGDSNVPTTFTNINADYYKWVLPAAGTYILLASWRLRFWDVTGYIKSRLYNTTDTSAVSNSVRMNWEQGGDTLQTNVQITNTWLLTVDSADTIHHQALSTNDSTSSSIQSDANGYNSHIWFRIS